jgi:hypothetical protein
LHAIEHHHQNGNQNDKDQDSVKEPAGMGIGLKNNPIQGLFQSLFFMDLRLSGHIGPGDSKQLE